MSSQSGCSDGRRGRPSRDERAELGRKDRSRTSARDSGRRDHFEHCQAARSRTSGRDLKQRGDFDPRDRSLMEAENKIWLKMRSETRGP